LALIFSRQLRHVEPGVVPPLGKRLFAISPQPHSHFGSPPSSRSFARDPDLAVFFVVFAMVSSPGLKCVAYVCI
jgi:hypothetical protein